MQFQKLGKANDPNMRSENRDMTCIWTLNSLEMEKMLSNPDFYKEEEEKLDNEDYIDQAQFYVENLQLTSKGKFMRLV